MINLTDRERLTLFQAYLSSEGNEHDFGLIEDLTSTLKWEDKPTLISVMHSLEGKGILGVYWHETVETDSGIWTQFTFQIPIKEVEELLIPARKEKEEKDAT